MSGNECSYKTPQGARISEEEVARKIDAVREVQRLILNSFLSQQLRAPCLPAIRRNELPGGFCLRAQHLLIKITLRSNGRPVCVLVGVGGAR